MNVVVEPERSEDARAIAAVNKDAFGRADEAAMVDVLRASGAWVLSLVARLDGAVVGHILFTRLHVGDARAPGLALAPLAVPTAHQRCGVGKALVREGLRLASARGEAFVVVVGHPEYYPRFGFTPVSSFGLRAPFEVRDEALMALELQPNGLLGVSGLIELAPEFGLASRPEDRRRVRPRAPSSCRPPSSRRRGRCPSA